MKSIYDAILPVLQTELVIEETTDAIQTACELFRKSPEFTETERRLAELRAKRESKTTRKPVTLPTAENQTRSEDSHYVPASRLYREHFRSYRGFKRWLTRTPENVVRRYRPRPNRLMIHLADWQAYWRVVDEEAWKRLDEAEARREVVRKRHVNPRRQPETNICKVVETTDAQ